jgi:hypothetical protein
VSQYGKPVIPDERSGAKRDPWFDRPFGKLMVQSFVEGLTTLSKIERGIEKCAAISKTFGFRLAPHFTGLGRNDELRHSLTSEGVVMGKHELSNFSISLETY